MTKKVKRRLTTIVCADVEGYSRLMEADETGTLESLRRSRLAMTTLIDRHDGRVVNTWGDAVIAEFSSVVEAVQCAVEIQQELSDGDRATADPKKMRFRIGINLGDVMVEGDDVYGDGVNIAARLQQLAESGGIMISGPVYDQVHNKLSIGFDRLGQQHVKNIRYPVECFRVVQGDAAAPSTKPQLEVDPHPQHGSQTYFIRLWNWYLRLPRPIAVICAFIGFLFLINVFTGLDDIWFHWPVLPLILAIVLWKVMRRKPS